MYCICLLIKHVSFLQESIKEIPASKDEPVVPVATPLAEPVTAVVSGAQPVATPPSSATLPPSTPVDSVPPVPVPSSETTTHGQSMTKREKTQTGKGKKDRLPRIQLIGKEDDIVECVFDTYRNERIQFKFGILDDEPPDVADNMVSTLSLL